MGAATGKAATNKETASEGALVNLIQTVQGETDPVRRELGRQYMEALQTGGVGAQIPLINAAQQQSRQATSQALQNTTANLGRAGLARTPFGQQTLAGVNLSGQQATGMLPSQITSQFLQGAPAFAFGGFPQSVAGYSQLAGLGAERDIAKAKNTASFIGQGSSAGGSAAGGALAAIFT